MQIAPRRAAFRLGRWTAKQALTSYLALTAGPGVSDLSALEITAAADGAPEAKLEGAPLPLHLSISHRDDRALCVVATRGVGGDLERVEARSERFARDYFTATEHDWIAGLAEADRAAMIATIWSAKEAALKLVRTGLRRDTRTVELAACPTLLPNWQAVTLVDHTLGTRHCGHTRVVDGWVWSLATDDTAAVPAPC